MKRILTAITVFIALSLTCAAQENPNEVIASEPKTGAVCRLPMEERSTVIAQALSSIDAFHPHAKNLRGFRCWQFTVEHPSNIYAVRKGTVVKTDAGSVRILHDDGTYARYNMVDSVKVAVGDKVTTKTAIARAFNSAAGKWSVRLEMYYLVPNPSYQQTAVSGKYKYLEYYINPVFTTRNKCKVQLTDGNAYVVSTRRRCFLRK